MEKEKVIAWLDRNIEADKVMREEYGKLKICGMSSTAVKEGEFPNLHVYECVDELADAVGVTVEVVDRDDEDYPYLRYFIYKGYCIFDVCKTEDGK